MKLAVRKVEEGDRISKPNSLGCNLGGKLSISKKVNRDLQDSGSSRPPKRPTSAASGDTKPVSSQMVIGKKRRVIGMTKKKVEITKNQSSILTKAVEPKTQPGRSKPLALSRIIVSKTKDKPTSSKLNRIA